MITFHEGLPRSGKSYEAMVEHIIPNVKKGRKIFAYIEGINHEKISQLTDVSLEEVQQLVVQVNRDDVMKIFDVVEDSSFVIIDELQNFFPSGRQKLGDGMTKFVTEHGHRGLDILAMGQSLADCHNLWKRRTEVKMVFTKMTAVGLSKSYRWQAYRGQLGSTGDIKYTKIRSGTKKYDSKYFGTYKSHVSEDTNSDDYIDDRSNVFKSSTFLYGVPIVILVLYLAVSFLLDFFFKEPLEQPIETEQSQEQKKSVAPGAKKPKEEVNVSRSSYVDYFDELLSVHLSRLTGEVKYKYHTDYYIEVVNSTYHNIDRFTSTEIAPLGWQVSVNRFGLVLSKGKKSHLIRYRSFDPSGSVNDTTINGLSN
jgi:zona occludens toxin